ncbi:phosphoenolpyruvate synthase [Parasulfuritortus cantonensis]|uniref:Phosphoenolpyruvate synthase n=1 Tax=Parasulfuritortus cantonensis TaxID=2528202 RepID=A0A4R1BCA0_9PROT|nr:PEP/pyruvate-binding domain-containing protein [Parasulfuritortus cantonensis]TCJ14665.1 phosphoenolpyruvate synthase [Parasulfuritortus cantonensis]
MTWTFAFSAPAAVETELVGGKGANLAILTQRGFPVPPGFVVGADAYRAFVRAAGDLLDRVESFSFDDPTALVAEAAELRAQLHRVALPAEVAAAIRAGLAGFPAEAAFSVRSSSTFEDLASAAFAGQHDTFLNVIGADAILDRVRDCFASLWQDRAIAYRRRQGFGQREATMAVVVQSMVRCEVAGVGFTVNPVSGALDEMLVNANYGLGESVVSGEGEVDQYVLAKDGTLLSSRIGRKTRRVRCAEQGSEEVEIDDAESALPCLTEARLGELADLMRRVEAAYQFPQDIEWGFDAAGLHLLQSRPVTSIPARWTRDESAERFPNAITPLAWDMVEEGFHRSLNHSFRLMGYPPFAGKWFGIHGHYIYGNQNAVELYGARAPFKITSLADLEAQLPTIRERFAWVQSLPMEWSRDLDRYLLGIGEFMAEPLADKDLRGVWDYVLKVNRLGSDYFLPNIAISITQRTLYKVLLGLLSMLAGGAEAGAQLFDDLMAHCETKTGVINKELYGLARDIRADAALHALVDARPSRELSSGDGLAGHPRFAARFEKFLADHGHRETDFDPYHPTWREAPWVVLDNLRLMAAAPPAEEPEDKEHALRRRQLQAEIALFAKLPAALHFFMHELLRLARAYTTLDDVEHYQTTRLTLPLRRGLAELGHRLARRDVVAEPMDVFFCRYEALDAAIRADDAARWDRLAEAVRAEKAAYLADRAAPPAWVLGEAAATEAGAGDLTGLPGSPGQAEGEVYLVHSPDDFANFPKGAVLVARTTNPAWTPLFYSACAVVTESGGPLSHGAVTAREMGIPAVMAVHGILAAVSNGQRLRVDGRAGRVTVID